MSEYTPLGRCFCASPPWPGVLALAGCPARTVYRHQSHWDFLACLHMISKPCSEPDFSINHLKLYPQLQHELFYLCDFSSLSSICIWKIFNNYHGLYFIWVVNFIFVTNLSEKFTCKICKCYSALCTLPHAQELTLHGWPMIAAVVELAAPVQPTVGAEAPDFFHAAEEH